MTDSEKYFGHATTFSGEHVALSREGANALWDAAMAAKEKRAEEMPTTLDAIKAISSAETRLEELGWSQGIYCPKDGAEFAVVQFGCTGIFTAFYMGEWPRGDIHFGDSSSSPDAVMWKALDALTDDERAKMTETEEMHRQLIEGEFSKMAALSAAQD